MQSLCTRRSGSSSARSVSAVAGREEHILEVRLEADTGLRRTGVLYETAVKLARDVYSLYNFELTGIYGKSDLRVGDTLKVIPNHVCSTVNLHDALYLTGEDGTVNEVPVAARGKVW